MNSELVRIYEFREMKIPTTHKPDLLYPELSFKIVGILFNVDNELGPGHKEKYYENAVATALRTSGLQYKQQLYVPLQYNGNVVGKYFLDFLVEEKIVLELKQGDSFSKKNIDQTLSYLKANKLQLGIIAQFTSQGVKYKRIVNLDS